MKVLWFSLTPSNYPAKSRGANGGGWISSLESCVSGRGDVELGVAFFHDSAAGKRRIGPVTYYPIRRPQSPLAKAVRFFGISGQDRLELGLCKEVVADFRPDVIHVFGTEGSFGLLAGETAVPVVIHLQGLMGPCLDAWVPPGYRMLDYAVRGSLDPRKIALGLRAIAFNRHSAEREREIMRLCKAFIGRTEWDRTFVSQYAPHARYFACWETLRPCFYEPVKWIPPARPVFVSTISSPLYKGHDMILKTARTLRDSGLSDFEWRVFGVADMRFAERKTGIRAADAGVRPMGVASATELRDALCGASAYVHPSYIENSPNSVCEAQMLGVPVVATNVGGVASLFSPDKWHCMVPANDPLAASSRILAALAEPEKFISDREACRARHSPEIIGEKLTRIWAEVAAIPPSSSRPPPATATSSATAKSSRSPSTSTSKSPS